MAKLRVVIELAGIEQARGRVADLGSLGERAANQMTAGFSKTEQQIVRMIQQTQGYTRELEKLASAGGVWAQQRNGITLLDSPLNRAAGLIDNVGNAQHRAAGHAENHGRSLNKLTNVMESVVVQTLALDHHLSKVSVVLAEMGAGGGPVLAVIGTLGALGFAWEELTEKSREAIKEQDAATKSLIEFNKVTAAGAGGQLAIQLDQAREKAKRLREELEHPVTLAKRGPGFAAKTLLDVITLGLAGGLGKMAGEIGGDLSATTGAVTSGDDNLAKQFAKTTGAIELQTRKTRELIAAQDPLSISLGTSALAVALINDKYEYLNKVLETSTGFDEAERAKILSLAAEHRAAADAAAQHAEKVQLLTAQVARFNSELSSTLDKIQQSTDARAKAIESMKVIGDPGDPYTPKYITFGLSDNDPDSPASRLAAGRKLFEETEKASKEYADEMRHEWYRGIDDIVSHGLQSFEGFFDGVLRMFTRMMSQMERAGKNSGLGYQLLGLGSAAIGGGLAGYQIGQQSGNSFGGIFGGAASGAATGSIAGPWGAVIGGFAGAVGGLLGAADSQREAAKRLREAAEALNSNIASFESKSGLASTLGEIEAGADALRKQIRDTLKTTDPEYYNQTDRVRRAAEQRTADAIRDFWRGIGEEWNALSGPMGEYATQQSAITRQYIEQVEAAKAAKASQEEINGLWDLMTSKLDALAAGIRAASDAATSSTLLSQVTTGYNRYQFQSGGPAELQTLNRGWFESFQQYADTVAKTRDAAELSTFLQEISNSIAQQELQVAQDQLTATEASVSGLQQTLTALRRTSDALALSDLSPLNARQRYHEADRQLEAQFKIAMGGGVAGQNAAQGIDSFIQNLLRESKNRFASGTPFASDYNRAQSMLDALEGIYGPQLTTEEKTLAELKKHTDLLTKQLDTSKNQLVEQLVARANDHPDADTVGQVSQALRRLGYAYGGTAGHYFAYEGDFGGNSPGKGNTGDSSTIYNPGYQGYVDAQHGNIPLDYQAWLDAGQPAYAGGTSWHRGGMALVGERGPELVNLPRGSSVTNQAQFAAPIVAELRTLNSRMERLEAAYRDGAGEMRRAVNARGK